MRGDIQRIEQSFSLDGDGVTNYLVIQLTTGIVIRAEVDEEATKAVLEARTENGQGAETVITEQPQSQVRIDAEPPPQWSGIVEAPSPSQQEEEKPAVIEQVFRDPEDGLINWARLSPDQLSPMMKQILKKLDIPELVTEAQLNEIIEVVQKGIEDGEIEAAPLKKPAVSVRQNQRTNQSIPPIRTVQKDSMGNPIVPASARVDNDPGEIVGDVDEDGVGQL